MRFFYTAEHLAFLKSGYLKMQIPELTAAFNKRFGLSKSREAIKSACSNNGFKCGRQPGNPKGTLRVFTPQQIEFLRAQYRLQALPELTSTFNETFGTHRTATSIRAALHNRKFASGRTGRFEKGQESWNTGTHFTAGGRSAETRFKKGHKPQTWVPIGTEVLTKDGYIKRKVRDDAAPGLSRFNWEHLHTLVWEQHNGPVPKGHAVCFHDGNKENCAIENLFLLKRSELCYLNRWGIKNLPTELKPAMRSLAKLQVKRFGLERKQSTTTENLK